MKPHLPWVTLTSTAVLIPMPAAPRSGAVRSARTAAAAGRGDLAAGAWGAGRVGGLAQSSPGSRPGESSDPSRIQ